MENEKEIKKQRLEIVEALRELLEFYLKEKVITKQQYFETKDTLNTIIFNEQED